MPHTCLQPVWLARLAVLLLCLVPLAISADRKPPQPPIVFSAITPDTLRKDTDKLIAEQKAIVDKTIKEVKIKDADWKNVVLPYLRQEDIASLTSGPNGLLGAVGSLEMQEASSKESEKFNVAAQKNLLIDPYFKLYDAVYKKYNKTNGKDDENKGPSTMTSRQDKGPRLPIDSWRILGGFWEGFVNAGLNLTDKAKFDRIKAVDRQIQKLENEASQAVVSDKTLLWLTPQELDGVPKDILASLKKGNGTDEGKLGLPLRGPSQTGASAYINDGAVRLKNAIAVANILPSNVDRLQKLIVLRDERARIIDWPNFAEYRLHDNMAENTTRVHKFLKDVRVKLKKPNKDQIQILKDYKLSHRSSKAGQEKKPYDDNRFWRWDSGYYGRLYHEKVDKVIDNDVEEYFPVNTTVQRIVDMYSKIYGFEFHPIRGKDLDNLSPTGKGDDLIWNEDVLMYSVWNTPKAGGNFAGYLYLDLYYRQGKSGGAFQVPIHPGFVFANGTRWWPSAGLVTSSRKSTGDKPSLLKHDEVQTILHELGHCMHHLSSKVRFSRLHGPSGCPPDYFEAPSQMMENFNWEPSVLKYLSQHYSYLSPEYLQTWQKDHANDTDKKPRPPEKMSDEMISNLRKSRYSLSATTTLGQTFLSIYDIKLHEQPSQKGAKAVDTTLLFNHLNKDIIGLNGPELFSPKKWKWGHWQAQFGHILNGGYEAGYYAYLWSKVYADDMFVSMFEKDPFSGEVGMKFRKAVLEPGGSKDYEKMLEDFLGRKPNKKGFYKQIGLKNAGGGEL